MLGANGDWSIGRRANNTDDTLVFQYCPDESYVNTTNQTYKIYIPIGGTGDKYLYAGTAQTSDPGVNSSLSTNTILLVYEA